MAGMNLPGNGSGKKSLNCELNLVPFIDLLSVSICFLLMTAVWIQLGSVPVVQEHGTEAESPGSEINVVWSTPNEFQLTLVYSNKKRVQAAIKGATSTELMTQLKAQVTDFIQSQAPLAPSTIVAKVTTHPTLPYSGLVDILDVLRGSQISKIGIEPPASGGNT